MWSSIDTHLEVDVTDDDLATSDHLAGCRRAHHQPVDVDVVDAANVDVSGFGGGVDHESAGDVRIVRQRHASLDEACDVDAVDEAADVESAAHVDRHELDVARQSLVVHFEERVHGHTVDGFWFQNRSTTSAGKKAETEKVVRLPATSRWPRTVQEPWNVLAPETICGSFFKTILASASSSGRSFQRTAWNSTAGASRLTTTSSTYCSVPFTS